MVRTGSLWRGQAGRRNAASRIRAKKSERYRHRLYPNERLRHELARMNNRGLEEMFCARMILGAPRSDWLVLAAYAARSATATFRSAAAADRQPRAGATSRATSSIDRRIIGCGGSTECTWTARSVTRSNVLSARRDAMTSA